MERSLQYPKQSPGGSPNGGWKTTKADEITWQGCFEGRLLLIVTTVRLTGSNLAHFCVNSGARIGENGWKLNGGYFVDLRVITRSPLSPDALHRLGELARTEDNRPIAVRQGRELLAHAIRVPEQSRRVQNER